VISQIARLLVALAKALDLLNIVYLEDILVGCALLKEKGNQNRPLGVCVDATTGFTLVEGGQEERRALRGFEGWGRTKVDALFWISLGLEGENIDVFGLHQFFLDAGRGEIDEITADDLLVNDEHMNEGHIRVLALHGCLPLLQCQLPIPNARTFCTARG